ncbi:MAG TPA: phage head-tail connector protein [Terracidiphilus sp.]|nr:phage head-tail connector protein [Terracidiphilus sp.]
MPLNVRVLSGPAIEPITVAQAKAQCRLDAGFTADDSLFAVYVPAARQIAEKITRRAFFNQTWRRTLDNFPLAASFDLSPTPADRWNWPVYGGMWNRLAIDLPGGDVVRIVQIQFRDTNNNLVLLPASQYAVDLTSTPCRITPANGFVWPFEGSYLPGSVWIDYEPASYVVQISETFTVPAAPGPYTYALLQGGAQGANVTAIDSVVDAQGNPITDWTPANGVLTFQAGDAGKTYTVAYCVAKCPEMIQAALLMIAAHLYRNPEATTDLKLSELPLGAQMILSPEIVEWTDYRPC